MEKPERMELVENYYEGIQILLLNCYNAIPVPFFFFISGKTISDETKRRELREKIQQLEIHIFYF